MRKCTVLLILLVSILFVQCASAPVKIRSSEIITHLKSTKQKILADRNYLETLKTRRVAKSGFYYILDANGVVVFHSQELLIGRNFKFYPFVKKILEKGDGCITYMISGNEHLIVFERLNNWEILCLSIEKKQIDGSFVICEPLEQ